MISTRFLAYGDESWLFSPLARRLSGDGFSLMDQPSGRRAGGDTRAPKDIQPGSITYDDVSYPYPVSYLPLTLYGQDVRMAYMDVPPAGHAERPHGGLVPRDELRRLLLRRARSRPCATRASAWWCPTRSDSAAPRSRSSLITFTTWRQHAASFSSRWASRRAAIVGHSMGGMLAARFAASLSGHHRARGPLQSDRPHRRALGAAVADRRRGLQSDHGAD